MGFFNKFSKTASEIIGSSGTFFVSCLLIILWLISGPYFGFSEDWQLIVNTVTTIITFLIAFLIQHTQNRDSHTLQLKLDELIRAVKKAKNDLIDLDSLSDEQLKQLEEKYKEIAQNDSGT